MDEAEEAPRLLVYLFGEAAGRARRGASARLERWCEAFEGWLEELGGRYQAGVTKKAKLAWGRLLRERGKMPWELEREDFEAHAAWMAGEGYAAATIGNALGSMASFYRWCDERRIDPGCEAGFNPAAGAQRPKVRRYEGARLLSREETAALLGILRRDESLLGKRDYALLLTRLRVGAPLESLRKLRWGQIEVDEAGEVWVRWRAEGGRARLAGEAWEAIREWLEAGGRLEGMGAESYVFAPAERPLQAGEGEEVVRWVEGRAISSSSILASLKLYGRQVGIGEDKLTLMALRRTATRLRLEAGDDVETMKGFLDSREEVKSTKSRLRRLPELPKGTGEELTVGADLPARKARPFREGEGKRHGLYALRQPAAEVLAVVEEEIEGIEEEIAGLRWLGRGLVEKQAQARSSKEAAQLAGAYTLAAMRLGGMIEAEKGLAKDTEEDQRVERTLTMLEEVSIEAGGRMRREDWIAAAMGGEAGLAVGSRRLAEEVASTRLVLRNTLALAREAEERGDTGEFVHLTEIYSQGCSRLMRLLRAGKAERGRVAVYLRELLEQAIQGVLEEMGLTGSTNGSTNERMEDGSTNGVNE
ncbi:MAG: hypothetical protein AB1894_27200 [Chloroflexota bacterium]